MSETGGESPQEEMLRAGARLAGGAEDLRAPDRGLAIGFVVFVLGFVCGVPLAMFAPSLVAEYGRVVIGAVLFVLFAIALLLAVLFLLRDRIWRWAFRRGEIELWRLAEPLSQVAKNAAERRVGEATDAARTFAEIALARYAWVSTRRWLIGSIAGLIAAIAALAGSALLFEQNRLLREQSEVLRFQTDLLQSQSALLDTQTQLAEAERSAQFGPQVVEIGAIIGRERQAYLDAGNDLDDFSLAELSTSTRSRIAAASLVARPYRYLRPREANPLDDNSLIRKALSQRPDVLADRSALEGFTGNQETELIDTPVSPERGDILSMLMSNAILDTEMLSFVGADFSFAEIRREVVGGFSLRMAKLSFADFSWARIVESRFGGAKLEHAVFRNTVISRSDFSTLSGSTVPEIYAAPDGVAYATALVGTRFDVAVVVDSRFRNVNAIAPVFDDAALANNDFSGAILAAASFRNAILLDNDFAGAAVKSLDLEGAIVFDAAFLGALDEVTMAGTFVADRWRLEPLSAAELAEHPRYIELSNHVDMAALAERQAFRIRRADGTDGESR